MVEGPNKGVTNNQRSRFRNYVKCEGLDKVT